MKQTQKILIVDDDRTVCASLDLLFKRAGYTTNTVSIFKEVIPTLNDFRPDLVMLDMNFSIDTSGRQGLQLLREIKKESPEVKVILITGWATIQLAVEGMKLGASDFLAKPWDNRELLASVRTIFQIAGPITTKNAQPPNYDHIIGSSPEIKDILNIVDHVAKTNAAVLVEGESGVGKELIAEAIHYNSLRADAPFVKVNLGGISNSLFESELFGHKKGAFTDATSDRIGRFELAHGGTIFLDEIGELNATNQVKLLRVLQEKIFEPLGSSKSIKVDIRIVSATNRKLEQMVEDGAFREDLYYRINLIKIELPPLRQRRSDIKDLALFFFENAKQNFQKPNISINNAALDLLMAQDFPGNIRQLKNLMERTVLLKSSGELNATDFQNNMDQGGNRKKEEAPDVKTIRDMEKQMIQSALEKYPQNMRLAAKSLGITRSGLYRRIKKHDIDL